MKVGDGKRFLCKLGGNLWMSGQTRALRRISSKTIRTKEEMEAYSWTSSASSDKAHHSEHWPV
jgi:hypothetical protein